MVFFFINNSSFKYKSYQFGKINFGYRSFFKKGINREGNRRI